MFFNEQIFVSYIKTKIDGAARLLQWFSENQMNGNTDKCHWLITKDKSSEIHIFESMIKSSDYIKLPGIKIESKLHFWWSHSRSMQKNVTENYEH